MSKNYGKQKQLMLKIKLYIFFKHKKSYKFNEGNITLKQQ